MHDPFEAIRILTGYAADCESEDARDRIDGAATDVLIGLQAEARERANNRAAALWTGVDEVDPDALAEAIRIHRDDNCTICQDLPAETHAEPQEEQPLADWERALLVPPQSVTLPQDGVVDRVLAALPDTESAEEGDYHDAPIGEPYTSAVPTAESSRGFNYAAMGKIGGCHD